MTRKFMILTLLLTLLTGGVMAQNTGKCIVGNILYDYDNNLKYELTRVPTADDPGEATLIGFIDKDNATTELVLENKIVADKDKTKDPGKVVNDFAYTTGYAVTMIGKNAFEGNTSLKSVDMTNLYDFVIGQYAFSKCESLSTVKFNFDSYLGFIGSCAFQYCAFTEITLPARTKEIDLWAFRECKKLETFNASYGLQTVANFAFYECSNLKTVNFHFGSGSHPLVLTSLGDDCFFNCTSLSSIELPESVTSLGENCFYNCI